MYQIDNSTAALAQPASTPAGTAGFFTDGNPASGTAATIVPAEWLNAVMMELANLVTGAGLTLNKASFNQVQQAVQAYIHEASFGRYLGTRVFTASGTYTPTSGTTSVIVGVIGGGGYGGASIATGAGQVSVGGGGGAGGQAWSRLTSGFSGVSMTIGAGGTGGSGVGGTTSFGALLSAAGGGVGGQGPASAPPYVTINGFGGVGSSGNLYNGKGGDGACGIASSTSSFCSGGGGSSFFGCGGNGQPTGSGAGVAATTAGGGGGGALAGTSTGAFNGGNGAAGAIIIHEYA